MAQRQNEVVVRVHLDHRKDLRHLALTGSGIEEPRRGQQDPVDPAEGGEGHSHGDQKCKRAIGASRERLDNELKMVNELNV